MLLTGLPYPQLLLLPATMSSGGKRIKNDHQANGMTSLPKKTQKLCQSSLKIATDSMILPLSFQ